MPPRLDDVAVLVELNQAELERALESRLLTLWDSDLVAAKTWASPNQAELFGLDETLAHFPAERFFEFVHPEDRARIAAELAAQSGAEIFEIECRIITGKGALRWIRACGRTTYGPDGMPIRAFGATTDITARKLAKAAIAGTMPRLRFLADLAEALARQTTFSDTLSTFARQVVDAFADGCLIDFTVGPSQRRSAYAHRLPEKERLLAEITTRYPPVAGEMNPVAEAIRSGRSALFCELDEDRVADVVAARGSEYGELLRRLEIRSSIIVPLVIGDLTGAVSYLCAPATA